MIGYISGLIIDKDEKSLLILAGNVGYKVFVPTNVLSESKMDHKTQLFIHTAVKEDDISLYGFKKKDEMKFYQQLLSVSGVGPKMGLEILSAPMNITQNAILGGDSAMLTKIKGLGKKTAERIIIELKDNVTPSAIMTGEGATGAYNDEALSALMSLVYEKYEIIRFLSDLPSGIKRTEDVIKRFLKEA